MWAFLTEADKIGRWLNQLEADLTRGARYEMTNSAGNEGWDSHFADFRKAVAA